MVKTVSFVVYEFTKLRYSQFDAVLGIECVNTCVAKLDF